MESKKKRPYLFNIFLQLLEAEKCLLWSTAALCLLIQMPGFGPNAHWNACKCNYWPFFQSHLKLNLNRVNYMLIYHPSKRQMCLTAHTTWKWKSFMLLKLLIQSSLTCQYPVLKQKLKKKKKKKSFFFTARRYFSTYVNGIKRLEKINWSITLSLLQLQVKKR